MRLVLLSCTFTAVLVLCVATAGCDSKGHGTPTDTAEDGQQFDQVGDTVNVDGEFQDQGSNGEGLTDQGGDIGGDQLDVGPEDLADLPDHAGPPDSHDIDGVTDISGDMENDTSDIDAADLVDLAQPECGNGVIEGTEQCDELDELDGDGCDTDCTYTEIIKVETGFNIACALIEGGRVRCWGQNHVGQLGLGHTSAIGDNELPSSAGDVTLPVAAKDLTVGDSHSCILTMDNDVICWGMGGNGRLGYGNTNNIGDDEFLTGLTAVPVGGKVEEVRAGGSHTCARLTDGTLRCWGTGGTGVLGYGNTNSIGDNETPASAGNVPVGAAVLGFQAGITHSCAITADQAVRCWGSASGGGLGYGNTNSIGDNEPVSNAGTVSCQPSGTAPGTKPVAVSASFFSCALYSTGDVLCWGSNDAGQLGQGNTTAVGDNELPSTLPPIKLAGKAIAISTGDSHACALTEDHKVRCWGSNSWGELGLGNTTPIGVAETPDSFAPIDFDVPIRQIEASPKFTCALSVTNELRCWGSNDYGQLGQGNQDILGNDELPKDIPPIQLF